ncbi:hypothetical protein R3P38DRAFT_3238014 [Favolaschia claudopus]|uniref:Uncharacterized protein n=1 Tax=Favolaschia claudopus TaxID=2862362 RepID=A0AAV9ZAW2_9AGAR
MTEITATSAETNPAVAAAAAEPHIAAAFQTVLSALDSICQHGADAETVAAFQTVLDTISSFTNVFEAQAAFVDAATSPAAEDELVASFVNVSTADTAPTAAVSVSPVNAVPMAAVSSGNAAPIARLSPFGTAPTDTLSLFGAAPRAAASSGFFPSPPQLFGLPSPRSVLAPATPSQPLLRTTGPWIVGYFYIVVPPQHLAAIPETPEAGEESGVWYCISKGRYVGVTLVHSVALAAIVGVSGGSMRSYKTQVKALDAFNAALDFHSVAVVL